MATVEAKVQGLERKLNVEMSMRDGLTRLAEQYEASQNAAARAGVLATVTGRLGASGRAAP